MAKNSASLTGQQLIAIVNYPCTSLTNRMADPVILEAYRNESQSPYLIILVACCVPLVIIRQAIHITTRNISF